MKRKLYGEIEDETTISLELQNSGYEATIVFWVMYIAIIKIDYLRKQKFYNNLVQTVEGLDKKYLVLEMINQPNFYEGKIFYQTLYEINKFMIENVKEYSLSIADFKEYVEMWIHEVKIPISSLVLLNHNHKNSLDSKYVKQKNDLGQVFDKCFTGKNGREKSKSTGMGLYIAKNLCVKLGHRIEIESEAGGFTRVVITFGRNDFYKFVENKI